MKASAGSQAPSDGTKSTIGRTIGASTFALWLVACGSPPAAVSPVTEGEASERVASEAPPESATEATSAANGPAANAPAANEPMATSAPLRVAPIGANEAPPTLPPAGTTNEPIEQQSALAVTQSSRTPQQIQAVMADNRYRARQCYEQALAADSLLGSGLVVVSFVISPAGQVKTSEVVWAESQLHSPEVEACLLSMLGTLTFPVSTQGLESSVKYPFDFKAPKTTPRAPAPHPSRSR